MQYHILNGDALKDQIPTDKIAGHFIICRECLIDGPLEGASLIEFWDNRAAFIEKNYGTKSGTYNEVVLPEFQKILELDQNEVVNLWFGDDLFCLMNLCFVVYLLDTIGHQNNIFLVKAQTENWLEFGGMSPSELTAAYDAKKPLTKEEFDLLLNCWAAFQQNDLAQLQTLAKTPTNSFPFLSEVLQAHIDRFPVNGDLGRPQRRLQAIQSQLQTTKFGEIFQVFNQTEGVYGFGDLQVRAMYEALKKRA
ncbi:MAG: DUF1835 domain-containing protein [Bacteroidota bacterium]